MNRKRRIAASVLAIMVGYGLYLWVNGEEKPKQDMNDRIIAQTVKCVSAGLEPEIERTNAVFGVSDQFIVVCKPPGGKESNLDRMMRQMGLPERGSVKKQEPTVNTESFEYKQKRTE